ncbi:lactase-like protein [Thalassophryne amazonica]|uniref:lactase-like protein n=1 Tax=Thalassophryne amazonica TaxID=390379 RepID=UPI00147265FE|nr:lactase-like protein [Thalassophryne amazonica]
MLRRRIPTWYHMLTLVLCVSSTEVFDWTKNERSAFFYSTFPSDFSWGAGSSAYQTEGAWNVDGKGMSIWDEFSHRKGAVFLNDTGDSSCEGYYKFKDDVVLMKDMKLNHYRFSISWPRILPSGLKSDHINEKGIKYYDSLITTLLDSNITPIVTLYHWDLPQVLQEKYGGWQNVSMVSYSNDFASLCFERFGNKVKHWIMFNNPWTQYGNPTIYVTENGVSEKTACTDLCDDWRMQYFKDYIHDLLKAIKDGVKVKGYTAWSLLDNFEWDEGYSERFGLYYVDFRNKNKPRYPKASVQYYKRIISSNGFPNHREVESWTRKARETCSSSNQLLAAS